MMMMPTSLMMVSSRIESIPCIGGNVVPGELYRIYLMYKVLPAWLPWTKVSYSMSIWMKENKWDFWVLALRSFQN